MDTITFNALRRIKDALPEGSTHKMAELLNTSADYVRNYFGGDHRTVSAVGIHFEQGPDGGLVTFDDPTLLNLARMVLKSHNIKY
ncbi:hypothetical protein FACS1894156_2230 [Bacteroidia bacterium]|nr:hypothetical protein AGMMS4956_20080 [Bacteroidia bacterium]GHU94254.1 hypothetical protein FACS1894156_2230 [Bacteroidia bacterium]